MNKFTKLISDNSSATLKRRAGQVSTQAEISQQTIINTLKTKVTELELKMDNLVDFAPSSTDSLRIGSKDWKPTEWAEELQRTKWEHYLAKKQLEIAQETWDEFFKDEDNKTK